MARESKAARQTRARQIVKLLKRYYPDAECALHHRNAEELLIATVLSAQCTDERVNQVTPHLFARYPTMDALASADQSELESVIRPTGFFRNKAKALRSLAQSLVDEHGGRVPRDLKALTALKGVGRKTANVVLGNAFGLATGVVVDTHVGRLSRRLGLTSAQDPGKVEADLQGLIDPSDWIMFSHWLIQHGRLVCKARKPDCARCFLSDLCPQKIP